MNSSSLPKTRLEQLTAGAYKLFIPLSLALALTTQLFLLGSARRINVIRSDGMGYYSYLPAAIILQDLSFETLGPIWGVPKGQSVSLRPYWGINRHPKTGLLLNKYCIGVAVLQLPFFLVADSIAVWSGYKRTGLSLPYQLAVAAAGIFYLLVGLVALRGVLSRHFSQAVTVATLTTLLFATNLLNYAVYDGAFSHVYSFATVSLLLLLLVRWSESPSVLKATSLAACSGVIFLIRPPNGLLLCLLPLYGLRLSGTVVANKLLWLCGQWRQILLMGVVFSLVVSPQLLLWRWTSGQWIVNSYINEGFCFRSPFILQTLFSLERGVLFWSPALVLAILGLPTLSRTAGNFTLALPVTLAAHLYLVASWCAWRYGAGFGHRVFVDVLPLLALSLASFLAVVQLRRLVTAFLVLCSILSLYLMLMFWSGLLPGDRVDWETFRELFEFRSPITSRISLDSHCQKKHVTGLQPDTSCEISVTLLSEELQPLSGTAVELMTRTSRHQPWEVWSHSSTDSEGQVRFAIRFARSTYVRFRVSAGGDAYHSPKVHFKIKSRKNYLR